MAASPIAIVSAEWDVVDLIDSFSEFRIVGFIDNDASRDTGEFRHLGGDDDWPRVAAEFPGIRVALAIDSPAARRRLSSHYGPAVVELRSPHAHLSVRASVGPDCIIQRGVTVMPRARIGACCKLNVGSAVHHDAAIGDFSTLAPGCRILGSVVVGERVYVGAGAVVRQRCRIGPGSVIGAGAVVVSDVPADAVVVGVPAKRRLK